MYEGSDMVIFPIIHQHLNSKNDKSTSSPRGPSTSTVLGGSILVTVIFRLDIDGSRTLRSTSGGKDSCALPIRDAHIVELENGRSGQGL